MDSITTTEVRYGLRHKTTGKLARYSVTSNEGRDYIIWPLGRKTQTFRFGI